MSWSPTRPDVTFCFKQTVLIWVPCGFLWLFSLIDVYKRNKSRYSDIPWGFLNLTKSLVLFLLICLSFYDLAMMLSMRGQGNYAIYDVQIVSISAKIATFVSNL